ALKLLEAAGVNWIDEIDPFDGGPFVGAQTARVLPIPKPVRGVPGGDPPAEGTRPAIVSTEEGGGFRAVSAPAHAVGTQVFVAKEARDRLRAPPRREVPWTPLPPPSQKAHGRG